VDSITNSSTLPENSGGGSVAKKSFIESEKTMNFQTNSCYREKEKKLIVETLLGGHSILLVGKAGIGTSTLLKFAAEELKANGARIIKIAPNSIKQILISLAFQLNLYAEDDKLPTSPRLQREVTAALQNYKSIIVIDEANRLTVPVRAWLEELHEGGQILFLASKPAMARDLFLKLPRMELKPLDYEFIRKVIAKTAAELEIELTPADVANLQERCGGNPMLARRVVREHQIGLKPNQHDHTEWINGTPFLVAVLLCLTMIRFIGRGIGDTNLYILGGMLAVAASLVRLFMFSLPKGSSKLGG